MNCVFRIICQYEFESQNYNKFVFACLNIISFFFLIGQFLSTTFSVFDIYVTIYWFISFPETNWRLEIVLLRINSR